MLEELLKSREVVKNPDRDTATDGSEEVVYGTLEDVLPSVVNSLIQLPLVLSKLERLLGKRRRKRLSNRGDETLRPSPAQTEAGGTLPDCIASRIAAELLGVDKKTLDKLRRDGLLKWRVKNPNSTRREFLYETTSVLQMKNGYSFGEPKRIPEKKRRKVKSGYIPQYIKLK